MNKKAFTLMEMLASVVILGIIGAIAVGSYFNYQVRIQKKAFEMAEITFKNNVRDAYTDCLGNSTNEFCSNHQTFGYQDEIIYLSDLIENGYSDEIKNPYNTESYCDENLSYVKVTGSDDSGNNKDATYQVCLVCGDKQSVECSNE